MASKQIKDFDLKESIDGLEDLLIQDSDGVTKRIKTSKLMDKIDLSNYYTKAEVDDLLANTDLSVDMADYYNKATIDSLLAKKANATHTHSYNDLTNKPTIPSVSGLATKKELTDGLATKSGTTHNHDTLYSKLDHTHSQYLTSIPSEYVTETELNTQLAKKANVSDIPSLDGYATETYVQAKIAEASLGGGEGVDLSGLATKDELALKADISSIPTKVSQLKNDSGFLTSHQDLSDYALKTEIPTVPTKVSQFTNDKGYLTAIPSEYVTDAKLTAKGYATETGLTTGLASKSDKTHNHNTVYAPIKHEHSQYLTEHQDISKKADKTELHAHSNKAVLDGITSAKVTEWNSKSDFDGNYNSLTNKPTIPTSLPAKGGNADTVNNIRLVVLSQAEYDTLEVKDETTLYIIKG